MRLKIGATPVDGSREANGTEAVCRAGHWQIVVRYNNSVHTAKCRKHLPGAHRPSAAYIPIPIRRRGQSREKRLTDTLAAQDYELSCLN